MVEAQRNPQFIGKADARAGKENRPSPEQTQFHNRYQAELTRAQAAERLANREARDKMKGLTAKELREAGLKQTLWGAALMPLNAIGAGLGFITTSGVWIGTTALATSAASGTLIAGALGVASVVSGLAILPMTFGGLVAGAESARYIYNRFARKVDPTLLPVDKTDRALGDLFALAGFGNAPLVGGVRNIYEGFNQMKMLQ